MNTPKIIAASEAKDILLKQLIDHINQELTAYWKGKTILQSEGLTKRVEFNGIISTNYFNSHLRAICEEAGWSVDIRDSEHFDHVVFKYKW